MVISPFRKMPRLSLKIFLLITMCVVLPMSIMFSFLRIKFERYIQKELSNQVIQSISKSEQEIYQELKSMAAVSSVIVSDSNFIQSLSNESLSYYEKTVAFDTILTNLSVNHLFVMDDIKVTFFDLDGNVYSNWDTNYNNYQFLMEQDWVKQSVDMGGHISWSMFSPGYIISMSDSSTETYISLARSMLKEGVVGERLGTLIVSIEQRQFSNILQKYAYSNSDRIYVCVDNGEILLRLDNDQADIQEQIKYVFSKMDTGSGWTMDTVDNKQYLVSYYTISKPWTFNNQQLRILHYTDYVGVLNQVQKFSSSVQLSFIFFIFLLILVAGAISIQIVKPIQALKYQMQNYSVGEEVKGLDSERKDEIGSLNKAFIKMADHINHLFESLTNAHEIREKYRFESLRAQMNPHFLFNTLGSIRWMAIIRGADNMVQSIDALSGVLKHSMNRGGELITLKEELQSVKDYIFIQNIRYGDRCNIEIDVDIEYQKLYVVKFILQPIVENCILHGLKDVKHRGFIRIWADEKDKQLIVYVEDNGKGISEDVIDKLNKLEGDFIKNHVTGIGFSNVKQRISTAYGEPYGLTIESKMDSYTLVTYTLPIIKEIVNKPDGI